MKLPSGEIIALFGSTMPTVASPVLLVDWAMLKTKWQHLEDLPIAASSGRVDILLGSDVIHLTTAMKTRIGQDSEPTASWTRIGLIVLCAIGEPARSSAARSHMTFATDCDVDLLAQ